MDKPCSLLGACDRPPKVQVPLASRIDHLTNVMDSKHIMLELEINALKEKINELDRSYEKLSKDFDDLNDKIKNNEYGQREGVNKDKTTTKKTSSNRNNERTKNVSKSKTLVFTSIGPFLCFVILTLAATHCKY